MYSKAPLLELLPLLLPCRAAAAARDSSAAVLLTVVPTASFPNAAREILPGVIRLKTTTGMLFSCNTEHDWSGIWTSCIPFP